MLGAGSAGRPCVDPRLFLPDSEAVIASAHRHTHSLGEMEGCFRAQNCLTLNSIRVRPIPPEPTSSTLGTAPQTRIALLAGFPRLDASDLAQPFQAAPCKSPRRHLGSNRRLPLSSSLGEGQMRKNVVGAVLRHCQKAPALPHATPKPDRPHLQSAESEEPSGSVTLRAGTTAPFGGERQGLRALLIIVSEGSSF